MSGKQANTSEAGWALITEGVTSARIEAHRLKKMLTYVCALVEKSSNRDQIYQVAGDLIQGAPQCLGNLERSLDRTSYALAKIGEDHLKNRLSIADRALVEDGVADTAPFSRSLPRLSERVARRWERRRGGGGA